MPKDKEGLVERLRAPAYWWSGSRDGHEGENNAPYEAATRLAELEAENASLREQLREAKVVGADGLRWATLQAFHDRDDRDVCDAELAGAILQAAGLMLSDDAQQGREAAQAKHEQRRRSGTIITAS